MAKIGGMFRKENLWIFVMIILALGVWRGHEFSTFVNVQRFSGSLIYLYNLIVTAIIAIPIYLNLTYTKTMEESTAKLVVGSSAVIGFFFAAAIPNLNYGLIMAWAFNFILLIRFVWKNLKKEDKVDSFVVSQVFGITSAFIAPWWSLIVTGTRIPFENLAAGPTLNKGMIAIAGGILFISLILNFLGSRKSKEGEEEKAEEVEEEKEEPSGPLKKISILGMIAAAIVAVLSVDILHTPLFWLASSFIGGLVLNSFISKVQDEEKERRWGWRKRMFGDQKKGKKGTDDEKDKNEKETKESEELKKIIRDLETKIQQNKPDQIEELVNKIAARLQPAAQPAAQPAGYPPININIGNDIRRTLDIHEREANSIIETTENKSKFVDETKLGKVQKRLMELGREYLTLMRSGKWADKLTELQNGGFDKLIAELRSYNLKITDRFAHHLATRKKHIGIREFVTMISEWNKTITRIAEQNGKRLEHDFRAIEKNGRRLRKYADALESTAKDIDKNDKTLSAYDQKVNEYQKQMIDTIKRIEEKIKPNATFAKQKTSVILSTVDKSEILNTLEKMKKLLDWIIDYKGTKDHYLKDRISKLTEMKNLIKDADEFVIGEVMSLSDLESTSKKVGLTSTREYKLAKEAEAKELQRRAMRKIAYV